jgi:hypothetical protein
MSKRSRLPRARRNVPLLPVNGQPARGVQSSGWLPIIRNNAPGRNLGLFGLTSASLRNKSNDGKSNCGGNIRAPGCRHCHWSDLVDFTPEQNGDLHGGEKAGTDIQHGSAAATRNSFGCSINSARQSGQRGALCPGAGRYLVSHQGQKRS